MSVQSETRGTVLPQDEEGRAAVPGLEYEVLGLGVGLAFDGTVRILIPQLIFAPFV